MVNHDYRCRDCGYTGEYNHPMHSNPSNCVSCGSSNLEKQVSAPAVHTNSNQREERTRIVIQDLPYGYKQVTRQTPHSLFKGFACKEGKLTGPLITRAHNLDEVRQETNRALKEIGDAIESSG